MRIAAAERGRQQRSTKQFAPRRKGAKGAEGMPDRGHAVLEADRGADFTVSITTTITITTEAE